MKTKKLLSLFIASAISLQCAAVSVFASTDNAVTVVANDIDTDWVMQFNSWERLQPAYDYFSDWSVTDGFTHTHYGEKFGEVKSVAYYMTQDSAKAFTVYNKTEPSADYQAWFNRDADGKPIPYDENSTNAQLWYRKGRPNILARFNVGETTNNGQPIVISFDYQSTNPLTGAWVHGPGTAFKIMSGKDQVAYSLYNNADNKGFAIECIDIATAKATKKYITTDWDYDAEHSVKIVLSPELTAEGRYQMTAIELDGVVTKLEGVYGQTKGLTNVLIHSLEYSAGDNGQNKDYTDIIKNLKVVRGIAPVSVTSSVEDGATDVTDKNIALTFSDTVELKEGAVKVYENGAVMSSDSYVVTPGEDGKSATVVITEYASRASYKIAVNKALVSGLLGGEMEEDFEVNFVTAKKDTAKIVANDIETDWKMLFNGWERLEPAFDYYTDWTLTDGFTFTHNHDKYKELSSLVYYKIQDEAKNFTVVKETEPGEDYQVWYDKDAAGNPVKKGTGSDSQLWYRKNRHYNIADFAISEQGTVQEPAVISFTYRTTNASTGFYGNEPATSYTILDEGNTEAFWIVPNGKPKANNIQYDGFVIGYYDSAVGKNIYKEITTRQTDGEYHDIKVVISPERTADGRYIMEAISIDGVVTELENIYGMAKKTSDARIYGLRYKSGMKVSASFEDQIKNLVVQRGISSIDVTSSVLAGATDVIPTDIKLSFSDSVKLEDGAITVYENGTEIDNVVLATDNKSATITIPEYKNRTEYRIAVNKELVSGLLGGEMEEDFEVSFITAQKAEELEGSENLAANSTITLQGYSANGQNFTTVATDEDGVTTITIDNATWAKAADANKDKSGNQVWEYDGKKAGYASWNFAAVDIKNIADEKNSSDPLVISMDYAYENMISSSDNNDMWVYTGDTAAAMYFLSPFGASPAVSGSSWGGETYAKNVSETDWHSVQYVIDPTIDANGKTHMTQITLDGEVTKDTAQKWISYGTANDTDEYLNKIEMRLKRQSATSADGELLPTVLKIKNFKVIRAKEFNVAVDTKAITASDNALSVRFSDPVTEAELANLKVLKGTETVENAISSIALASDGLSAKIAMNLNATARYTLVTEDVANIYGVKSSTAPVEFEYYNVADGYVSVREAAVNDNGTDTTVSFTFTASKTVSPLVIVAAYDKELNLIGVGMKDISLTSKTDASDSITLEKVTNADKIQIMAWDSLESMKPYCMAKNVK